MQYYPPSFFVISHPRVGVFSAVFHHSARRLRYFDPGFGHAGIGGRRFPASAVVWVEDIEHNFPSFNKKPHVEPSVRSEDCRLNGPYRRRECAPPQGAQQRRARKPASAIKKTVQLPPLPVKRPDVHAAARALDEQERALQAPRPLMATALRTPPGAPAKAEPGTRRLKWRRGPLSASSSSLASRESGRAILTWRALRTRFKGGRLSGVIVSDGNISSLWQLRQLVLAITKDSAGAFPIVAIEQPGGPTRCSRKRRALRITRPLMR